MVLGNRVALSEAEVLGPMQGLLPPDFDISLGHVELFAIFCHQFGKCDLSDDNVAVLEVHRLSVLH